MEPRFPDATLERDRRLYLVLVVAFAVLTLVFGIAAIGLAGRDGTETLDAGRTVAASDADGSSGDDVVSGALDTDAATDQSGSGATGSGSGRATSGRAGNTGSGTGSGGGGTQTDPGGEIVVGSVVTQSGAASFVPAAEALRAFFADLNARGGINGRKVRLVIYDDAANPAKGREVFQRLIEQDKVVAIVGNLAPIGEGLALQMAEEAGVPFIPASGLTPASFKSRIAYFSSGTLENFGNVACKEALRQGQKRVALVYISAEQILPIIDAYEDCVNANGGAVFREEVPLGNPDYTGTVLRLRQFDPDVAFYEIPDVDVVKVWRSMERQGLTDVATQLVPSNDTPTIRDYEGAASNGCSIMSSVLPPHLDSPELRRIRTAMARYTPGSFVNTAAVDKWMAGLLFVETVKLAGANVTRQSLLAALPRVRNFDGNGLSNPFSYGPDKRTGTDLFWFFAKQGRGFGPVGPPRGP
jgi:branched-chain amino acid transport system substrate-binding protein